MAHLRLKHTIGFGCFFWLALVPAFSGAADKLPEAVAQHLNQHHIVPEHQGLLIIPLDGGRLQVKVGANRAMNPASTMKLLTTFAGLSILGPDFHWHTEAFADGPIHDGVLEGNLILRGGGDPSLVMERWWAFLQQLRAQGLRDIRGDLVIDRSLYAQDVSAEPLFDSNDTSPYNVPPDPLLINFRTLSLEFAPGSPQEPVQVRAEPPLAGLQLPAGVPGADGPCGDWKTQLKPDWTHALSPRFSGNYRMACGTKFWHRGSVLPPNDYALAIFQSVWEQSGGHLSGSVRDGRVSTEATLLTTYASPPLSEVIRDINKNSNNVMARQLFLSLGSQVKTSADSHRNAIPPTLSLAQSEDTLRRWMAQEHLNMPELVVRNGSGLSHEERISANSLAALLAHAWQSSDMPVFLASLPISGVDGTMQHRMTAVHKAYVKTGHHNDVNALAGYVFGASGHHYAVAFLINDPHAEQAQEALDLLLEWVWQNG